MVFMVVAVSKDTEDAAALRASSWLVRHPTIRHDEPAEVALVRNSCGTVMQESARARQRQPESASLHLAHASCYT